MKVKWKVSEAPTGPYRSFHKRGWPTAEYENGAIAAAIYCETEYVPSLVKNGDHDELTLSVADHSLTPWKWRKVKATFKTLKGAKEGFDSILKKHPELMPKEAL